jgi:hypothetical protein
VWPSGMIATRCMSALRCSVGARRTGTHTLRMSSMVFCTVLAARKIHPPAMSSHRSGAHPAPIYARGSK